MPQINQQTSISVGLLTVIVAACVSAYVWADGRMQGERSRVDAEFKESAAERAELRSLASKLESGNALLRVLVQQQSTLIEKAVDEQRATKEALIRIEAKLERPE